jgi:hypothetical protein
MDPYFVLYFTRGSAVKSIRGPTHKNGHKAPVWNWEIDIFLEGISHLAAVIRIQPQNSNL